MMYQLKCASDVRENARKERKLKSLIGKKTGIGMDVQCV